MIIDRDGLKIKPGDVVHIEAIVTEAVQTDTETSVTLQILTYDLTRLDYFGDGRIMLTLSKPQ